MEDMYHIPVNAGIQPTKQESIDFMNVIPPSFNTVAPALPVGSNTLLASSSTLVLAVFTGTASAAISTDGLNWVVVSLPVSGTWSGVAYGNSLFVLVDSASSTVLSSTDGVNWTVGTSPLAGASAVGYGNNHFVIVQSGSAAMCTTTNGTSFVTGTLPSASSWVAVAYASVSALWMVVAAASSVSATAPDGLTWTSLAMTASGAWSCLASNGTGFLALTNDASGLVNSSANGTSWTAYTWDTDYYQTVGYGGGNYMGAANSSGDTEYSPDGSSFTYGTPLGATHASSITYFAATSTWIVGQAGLAKYLYSSNVASTWTAGVISQKPFSCGAYGNGQFVALCSSGTTAYLSKNGFTWYAAQTPVAGPWASVTWGYDKFVALPTTGTTAMWSWDGVEWYPTTLPVSLTAGAKCVFGNGQWLTVGATVAQGMYSVDGTRWVAVAASVTDPGSITFGNNLFVSVFNGTSINSATPSPNVPTPRTGAMSSSTTWSMVAYGRGVFVAVNTTTSCAVSSNGLNWKPITLPLNITPLALVFAFGNFLAFGSASNQALASPDGLNWRAFTLPLTGAQVCAVMVGKNCVVVIGSDGSIMTSGDVNGAHYGNFA